MIKRGYQNRFFSTNSRQEEIWSIALLIADYKRFIFLGIFVPAYDRIDLAYPPISQRVSSITPPSGVPYANNSDSSPPKTAPVGNCRQGSVLIVAAKRS